MAAINRIAGVQWNRGFSEALKIAVSSAVATAKGKPELTIDLFADMMRAAEHDISQTTRLIGYALDFRPEPEEAVQLVCARPEIVELFDHSEGPEEFALSGLHSSYISADRRSFALELVARLVFSAVLSGVPNTVRRFDEALQRSTERNLPGLEATFVSGLSLGERWNIADGLYAVPYHEYRRRELVGSSAASVYDYFVRESSSADRAGRMPPVAVLLQEFRWGPALLRGPGRPEIRYRGVGGEPLDMTSVVNLLSAIGEVPLKVVGRQARAERWFYDLLDKNFDIGMDHLVRSPVEASPGDGMELSADRKAEFERLLPLWQVFAKPDRRRIDLAVSRLSGALSRTGSLSVEDRILDVAIALEILYCMTKRVKLSKRVGAFLGGDPVERARTESDVDRLYQCRVGIVHGLNAEADRDSWTEAASKGSNVARQTLRSYLKRGSIPERAEWTQLERTNGANIGGVR